MKTKHFILDTDVGSDCDDMMAIAYFLAKNKTENINLDAITYSFTSPYGPAAIKALCRSLGQKNMEVGIREDVDVENKGDQYSKSVAVQFALKDEFKTCENAVTVLRRRLAGSEKKITLVGVGLFTNFSALLDSEPDEFSDKTGVELVADKCERFICMAGCFSDEDKYKTQRDTGKRHSEWNIICDLKSARNFIKKCPVPVVFLPYEVGYGMITGKKAVAELTDTTPLTLSFIKFPNAKNGRDSWDPATVCYAINPDSGLFLSSKPGEILIDETGITTFIENAEKQHSFLQINHLGTDKENEEKARISEIIDNVVLDFIGI